MGQPFTEQACQRCAAVFRPRCRDQRYCSSGCSQKAWHAANKAKLREDHKRWYEANRDRLREYSRQRYVSNPDKRYHAVNREKHNEDQRRRRAAHPDEARAYKRAWYAANRDKVRGYTKRWCAVNGEKIREYDRRRRKAAMLKNMPDDPFVREIMAAMFEIRSEAGRVSHAHLRRECRN